MAIDARTGEKIIISSATLETRPDDRLRRLDLKPRYLRESNVAREAQRIGDQPGIKALTSGCKSVLNTDFPRALREMVERVSVFFNHRPFSIQRHAMCARGRLEFWAFRLLYRRTHGLPLWFATYAQISWCRAFLKRVLTCMGCSRWIKIMDFL